AGGHRRFGRPRRGKDVATILAREPLAAVLRAHAQVTPAVRTSEVHVGCHGLSPEEICPTDKAPNEALASFFQFIAPGRRHNGSWAEDAYFLAVAARTTPLRGSICASTRPNLLTLRAWRTGWRRASRAA